MRVSARSFSPVLLSALLVGAALFGSWETASAQGFEAVGTRALGMGGAFVAVADDASAVYWNPRASRPVRS